MQLTPETIDAALDAVWGAPWRENVWLEPGEDADSYAVKLTCLDSMACGFCGETWQDEDMALCCGDFACPECIKWPSELAP